MQRVFMGMDGLSGRACPAGTGANVGKCLSIRRGRQLQHQKNVQEKCCAYFSMASIKQKFQAQNKQEAA
jgi:hypothetical protein